MIAVNADTRSGRHREACSPVRLIACGDRGTPAIPVGTFVRCNRTTSCEVDTPVSVGRPLWEGLGEAGTQTTGPSPRPRPLDCWPNTPSNASVPAGAAAAAMPAAGPRHDLSLRLRMDCPSSKELGQCRPAHYGCCDAAPVTGCGDWTEGRSAACAVGTVVGKDLNPEHAEHWTSPQGCRRLDLQASRARSDACRSQVVGSRRPTGRRAPGLRHGACPRPTATREELNSPRKGPTCGGGHGRSVLVVDR